MACESERDERAIVSSSLTVNGSGQVVGYAEISASDKNYPQPQVPALRPVIWASGLRFTDPLYRRHSGSVGNLSALRPALVLAIQAKHALL